MIWLFTSSNDIWPRFVETPVPATLLVAQRPPRWLILVIVALSAVGLATCVAMYSIPSPPPILAP